MLARVWDHLSHISVQKASLQLNEIVISRFLQSTDAQPYLALSSPIPLSWELAFQKLRFVFFLRCHLYVFDFETGKQQC